MSPTKSPGDNKTTVHRRDSRIADRDSYGSDPVPPRPSGSGRVKPATATTFPANRTLRQGELPKR